MKKGNKKRGGKSKHAKREALLIGIPHENVNLYVEIGESIKFLKVNESTEIEEEKRTFNETIDYLI